MAKPATKEETITDLRLHLLMLIRTVEARATEIPADVEAIMEKAKAAVERSEKDGA
jgi:hypothetical protein